MEHEWSLSGVREKRTSQAHLTNGVPIEPPIICASSEILLVVPKAVGAGVCSFVNIIIILYIQLVKILAGEKHSTYPKASVLMRDMKSTTLIAIQSSTSAAKLRSGPAARAMILSTGMSANVTGFMPTVNR